MAQAQYQIILLKNNERIETVSSHYTLESVRAKFNSLLEEIQSIEFPVEYINKETIQPIRFHLAIIKRKSDDINENYRLQNDYGQFVDVIIEDNEEWIMYDRKDYKFEETFWVYGYNPRVDRKTFHFIYTTFFKNRKKDKNSFLNVKVYKNKLFLEGTYHSDLIICKNNSDAIRLHNMLYEYSLNDKLKYIIFNGDITKNFRLNIETRDKIIELTHWDKRKVNRCTT